jgi:hypothetical protein
MKTNRVCARERDSPDARPCMHAWPLLPPNPIGTMRCMHACTGLHGRPAGRPRSCPRASPPSGLSARWSRPLQVDPHAAMHDPRKMQRRRRDTTRESMNVIHLFQGCETGGGFHFHALCIVSLLFVRLTCLRPSTV